MRMPDIIVLECMALREFSPLLAWKKILCRQFEAEGRIICEQAAVCKRKIKRNRVNNVPVLVSIVSCKKQRGYV